MQALRYCCLVVIFIVAGCGSSTPMGPPGTAPPPLSSDDPPWLGALPPLPDAGTGRSASLVGPKTLPGVVTYDDFGHVMYGGISVHIVPWPVPDPGCVSGVVYELPVGAFPYAEVILNITFDDPEKLWFGYADYDRSAWYLIPAEAGMTNVPAPPNRPRSPEGNCYFAVIAYDDTIVDVHQVSINPIMPTWEHHVIDDSDEIGGHADIALIDGSLYVAYDAVDVDEIRLARATATVPAAPTDWDLTLVYDIDYSGGLDLEPINSLPAILFSET